MKKIVLLIMLLLTSMLIATTYTVIQDGSGDFVSINEAISDQNVTEGDIILVYPGIYYENINYNGKIITVASLYFTTHNSSYISSTIIDGDELGSVVTFNNGETVVAVLCGFTIQNGLGGDFPNYTGGGITITNGSSPSLKNLIITDNSSGYGGGGIYCLSSNPSINDVTITENTTQQYGAGICAESESNVSLKDVNIINNQTLEVWPFTEGVYVYGDSIGSYIQYDPESERNVGVGGGVSLYFSDAELLNVIIDSNISTEGAGLWGWGSNVTFDECEITNNSSEGSPWPWAGGATCFMGSNFNFSNSIINSNSSGSCIGGIIVKDQSTITMVNCEICDNTADVEAGGLHVQGSAHAELIEVLISGNTLTNVESSNGGGIFYVGGGFYGSSLSLDKVKIINNTAIKGGGLFLCYSDINLSNVEISQNNAQKGSGLYCIVSDPIIKNSTFAFNTSTNSGGAIYCTQNSYPELVNTILWDNLPQEIFFDENDLSNSIDIDYSDIEGGEAGIITNNNGTVNWGTGNINEDPLFLDPENYDLSLKWTETQKSSCIDTGDPNSPLDPDGTITDMGAYYHPHEVKTYEFPSEFTYEGWKWLSFDILDRTPDPYNIAENMLDPIKADDLLDYALLKPLGCITSVQTIEYDWILGTWENGDHSFTSPSGYKFHTLDACSLEIPGFRCEASTEFFIAGELEENWIGYFLEETQLVYDAFGDFLDDLTKIKAQHWAIKKVNGVWPTPVAAYTLSPGDMVIVYCERDIEEFSWHFEESREKYIVLESQDFTFEEEVDYIPVFISLDPEDLPSEIGAYVDGECKGATVVQDTSAQICAYILENQGENLEFEFSYGNRGQNKQIKEYGIYEPETSKTVKGTIQIDNSWDCYYVSFRSSTGNQSDILPAKLSASNYPNPFNPATIISYDLPSDGEIELCIYNIRGQQVKTLIRGEQIAGSYEVVWNGKDNNEKSVSSGIYFYKLSTKDETIMMKILMLK